MRIIGGKFRNRPLRSPKGKATRPTSSRLREAFFNICQTSIEGSVFLDVFAGAGAMGLEALSRGAARAVFIERDKAAISCIVQNVQQLEAEDVAEVLRGDACDVLKGLSDKRETFSIIYLDPPYGKTRKWGGKILNLGEIALRIVDEGSLLDADGALFIEEGKGVDVEKTSLRSLVLEEERAYGKTLLRRYAKAPSSFSDGGGER